MKKKNPHILKPKAAPSKEVQEKASRFYMEMELKAAAARSKREKKTKNDTEDK